MSPREVLTIPVRDLELSLGALADSLRDDPRGFYDFMPASVSVALKDNCVVLSGPPLGDAQRNEAHRLFKKAGYRTDRDEHEKARDICNAALEIDPMLPGAQIALGFSFLLLGQKEEAATHFLAAVKLEPTRGLALCFLGELLYTDGKPSAVSDRLIRRALELEPNDLLLQDKFLSMLEVSEKYEEGLEFCDELLKKQGGHQAEPYYRATFLMKRGDTAAAAEVLEQRFAGEGTKRFQATKEDRDLYALIQSSIAKRELAAAEAVVDQVAARAGELSGFPVRTTTGTLEAMVGAKVAMAWKHAADHHVLTIRKGSGETVAAHHALHELHHVLMESEARAAGSNKWFITTPQTRQKAFADLGDELQQLVRKGHDSGEMTELIKNLYHGVVSFLYNCPLDMFIESRIREDFPSVRAVQFCGVYKLAREGLVASATNDPVKNLIPRTIRSVSDTLNGTYAMFVDELFGNSTMFADFYRSLPTFSASRKLYNLWLGARCNLEPGDEYKLVDSFAEVLGVQGWFGWRQDVS